MKTILLGLILFNSSLFFAQTENPDTLKLLNGTAYLGSVEKIKTDVIEFKERETGLLYEFEKNMIEYLALSSGKVLTFDKSDSKVKASSGDSTYFETQKRNLLYIGGGIGIPLSPEDFSDYWGTGYNIGIDFTAGLSPVTGLGIAIDYNHFGLNTEKLVNDAGGGGYNINVSGGAVNILSLTLDLKVNLIKDPSRFQPFISVGIGYHNTETMDLTISAPGLGSQTVKGSSDDGFTYNAGFGFNIPLSKDLNLFMEGKYRSVKVENDNLNSFPLKAGLAILL